MKVITTDDE